MRKRTQYRKPKFQNKIPTLIIMVVMLVLILCFGKNFSNGVAEFFAPNVPVSDTPSVAVSDAPSSTGTQPATPSKTGSILSNANKNAAQKMLPVISGGTAAP